MSEFDWLHVESENESQSDREDVVFFDEPVAYPPHFGPPSPTDQQNEPPRRERSSGWLREILQLVLIVALVRIGMDTFMPRYIVDGASMEPNFHTSERVIVDRITMLVSGPGRGDVIVLDSPRSNDDLLIKRVIGLPNETVVLHNGRVYINGVLLHEDYITEFCTSVSCNGEWQLGPDQYFVLGDNRQHSLDSHSFGPVDRSAIKGVARVRYWPPLDMDILDAPEYE